MSFEISKHRLVPAHSKLSESEKKELLQKYNIDAKDLPKILKKDPAIAHLGVKAGEIIKVERQSPTAGNTIYYRAVAESA